MTAKPNTYTNNFRLIWESLKQTVKEFGQSNAFTDASSIAYFAIFSLPGLLIIMIWVLSNFMDSSMASDQIYQQIRFNFGEDAVETIQNVVENSLIDENSFIMKTVGVASLVFAASTLFFRLQKSLNELWKVEPAPKKAIMKFAIDRANSIGMILSMGFLMLVSTLISTIIAISNQIIVAYYGIDTFHFLESLNFVLSFGLTFLLFAFMFKFLPDLKIKWKSVWIGALLTSILFTFGQFLLSIYFDQFQPTSAFGTASSILLIMVWMNYTALILFFGVIYTRVYSELKGIPIQLSKHAKWAPAKKIELLEENGIIEDET